MQLYKLPSFHSLDFFLKQHASLNQSLGPWRASWNIDVHRNDTVNSRKHVVRVKVQSARNCTGAHCDNVFWFRHLVIDKSETRRHLSCDCSLDNNQVTLSQGSKSLDDSKSFDIISRTRCRTKLHTAARGFDVDRPQGPNSSPVDCIAQRFVDSFLQNVSKLSNEDVCIFRRYQIF